MLSVEGSVHNRSTIIIFLLLTKNDMVIRPPFVANVDQNFILKSQTKMTKAFLVNA